MKKYILFVLLPALTLLQACSCSRTDWSDETSWYRPAEFNPDYVDVFYLTSTNILKSTLPDGSESFRAVLDEKEKKSLRMEDEFVRREIFPDSLNFIAPYYHQFTMNCVCAGDSVFDRTYSEVEKEVYSAFKYYMKHINGGRRFIIAGFSQGAMLTLSLLKMMSDKEFSSLVAAYSLGYGISEEDLSSPHIIPAAGPRDRGVVISYNSVDDTDAIWPLVHNDACCCINPLNWTTDSTPATVTFREEDITVSLDTLYNVLKVKGFDSSRHSLGFEAPWPEGNEHHYEIFFYNSSLRSNVLDRCYH